MPPDWPLYLLAGGVGLLVLGALRDLRSDKRSKRKTTTGDRVAAGGDASKQTSVIPVDVRLLEGAGSHPVVRIVATTISTAELRATLEGIELRDNATAVIDFSSLVRFSTEFVAEVHTFAGRQDSLRRLAVVLPSSMMILDEVVRGTRSSTIEYEAFTPLHLQHSDETTAWLEQREPTRLLPVSKILDDAAGAFDREQYDAAGLSLGWADRELELLPPGQQPADELWRLVRGYRALGQPSRAEQCLRAFLEHMHDDRYPAGIRAQFTAGVGYCLDDREEYEEAIAWLAKARDLPKHPDDDEREARRLLTAAMAHATMNLPDFAGALAMYDEVRPLEAAGWHNVALCHQHLDDHQQAAATFERAHEVAVGELGASDPRTIENLLGIVENRLKTDEVVLADAALTRAHADAHPLHGRHPIRKKIQELRSRLPHD